MKIEIKDNEVHVVWGRQIATCTIEDVVKYIKEQPNEQAKRCAIVNLWHMFRVVDVKKARAHKMPTLDILDGCAKVADRLSEYELEKEIDDLLGADPYTPLY